MKTRIVEVTEWWCKECREWHRREQVEICEGCELVMCSIDRGFYFTDDDVCLCQSCWAPLYEAAMEEAAKEASDKDIK